MILRPGIGEKENRMAAKETKNTKSTAKDKNWEKIRAEADGADKETVAKHGSEKSEKAEKTDKHRAHKSELPEDKNEGTDEDVPSPEEAKKTAKELEELGDKYLHVVAEYDNYRRRAQKERESVYADAYADALKEILPIADNIERAATYTDGEKVLEGVQMVLKQVGTTLEKLGVEAFGEEGETFNPNIHNAVMHEENPDVGDNVITAVFQKGYKKGDRIIRFAMVRVAN